LIVLSSLEQHAWLSALAAAAQAVAVTVGEPLPGEHKVPLQLRLIGATALLLFTVVAMVVVIAYLMRAWRRQISEPITPTRLEADAWARRSLAPRDETERDSDP
jgi:hypothetical protein